MCLLFCIFKSHVQQDRKSFSSISFDAKNTIKISSLLRNTLNVWQLILFIANLSLHRIMVQSFKSIQIWHKLIQVRLRGSWQRILSQRWSHWRRLYRLHLQSKWCSQKENAMLMPTLIWWNKWDSINCSDLWCVCGVLFVTNYFVTVVVSYTCVTFLVLLSDSF